MESSEKNTPEHRSQNANSALQFRVCGSDTNSHLFDTLSMSVRRKNMQLSHHQITYESVAIPRSLISSQDAPTRIS